MTPGRCSVERDLPLVTELVFVVAGHVPDRVTLLARVRLNVLPGTNTVKSQQVAEEDALELPAVLGVDAARFCHDAARLQRRRRHGRAHGGARLVEQGRVTRARRQIDERADEDTLVVGKCSVYWLAGREAVQLVDDEVVCPEHPGRLEPSPGTLRPVEVAAGSHVARRVQVQAGRGLHEEQVRDRVLLVLRAAPVDPAPAFAVPAPGHASEDRLGHVEVGLLFGEIIGLDPGQRPPTIVIVEAVAIEVLRLVLLKGVVDIGEVLHVAGLARVVDHGRELIPARPPIIVLEEARVGLVPSLQWHHAGDQACF